MLTIFVISTSTGSSVSLLRRPHYDTLYCKFQQEIDLQECSRVEMWNNLHHAVATKLEAQPSIECWEAIRFPFMKLKLYFNGPCVACFNHAELHQAFNVYSMSLLQVIVKQAVLCAKQIGRTCVSVLVTKEEALIFQSPCAFVVSKWISVVLSLVLFVYDWSYITHLIAVYSLLSPYVQTEHFLVLQKTFEVSQCILEI